MDIGFELNSFSIQSKALQSLGDPEIVLNHLESVFLYFEGSTEATPQICYIGLWDLVTHYNESAFHIIEIGYRPMLFSFCSRVRLSTPLEVLGSFYITGYRSLDT